MVGETYTFPKYHLVPEYVYLHTSGLIRSKKVQDIEQKGKININIFGLVYLFYPVYMSSIRSILLGMAIFSGKMIHHEEN